MDLAKTSLISVLSQNMPNSQFLTIFSEHYFLPFYKKTSILYKLFSQKPSIKKSHEIVSAMSQFMPKRYFSEIFFKLNFFPKLTESRLMKVGEIISVILRKSL